MTKPAENHEAQGPVELSPAEVRQLMQENKCVLVDVREDAERREVHIPGTVAMPLSRFDHEALRRDRPDATFVFHCKAGGRSKKACSRFASGPDEKTRHLAGGIDAWIAAGQTTVKSESGPPIPIMRQVLLIAGLLVLLGTLLAAAISPWFLIVPGLVGFGLSVAGATGWCGMSVLLGKMPWNR